MFLGSLTRISEPAPDIRLPSRKLFPGFVASGGTANQQIRGSLATFFDKPAGARSIQVEE
jgi:hypothetical protein